MHFILSVFLFNIKYIYIVVALIGAFDFKQMRVPLGCLETIHNFEALCLEAIFFLKHDVLKQFFLKHFGLCAGQSNINF